MPEGLNRRCLRVWARGSAYDSPCARGLTRVLAGMPGARLLHRLPTTGCSNALTAACHTQPHHVPIHTHTHTHTHTHPPPQAAEHQASVVRLEREAADARKAADQLREVNKRMMSALQMSKEGGATAIRCARGRAACAAQGALRALWAGASGLVPSLGGYAQGPAAHRSAGQAARLFKECVVSKARPSAGCEVCTGLHGRSSAAGDVAEGVPVGGRHPTRSLSGRGLECVLMGVCVGVEFFAGHRGFARRRGLCWAWDVCAGLHAAATRDPARRERDDALAERDRALERLQKHEAQVCNGKWLSAGISSVQLASSWCKCQLQYSAARWDSRSARWLCKCSHRAPRSRLRPAPAWALPHPLPAAPTPHSLRSSS